MGASVLFIAGDQIRPNGAGLTARLRNWIAPGPTRMFPRPWGSVNSINGGTLEQVSALPIVR